MQDPIAETKRLHARPSSLSCSLAAVPSTATHVLLELLLEV
jgi:hypothetical protein